MRIPGTREVLVATLLLGAACYRDLPTATVSSSSEPNLLLGGLTTQAQTTTEQHYAASALATRAVRAVRFAHLNLSAGERLRSLKPIHLTVAPGVEFDASADQFADRGPRVSWGGRPLSDSTGWVQLVLGPAGIYATIRVQNKQYKIEPLNSGTHAILEVAPERYPLDETTGAGTGVLFPDSVGKYTPASPLLSTSAVTFGRRRSVGNTTTPRASRDGGAIGVSGNVDVVVGYTSAAASATSDIESLIQLAVDETNTAYSHTGIPFDMNLAHAGQVSYSEGSNNFSYHLNKWRTAGDGVMDEVHGWRDQYYGDVALLLVNDDEACGLASTILASSSNAFAIVHWDCATGKYSFSHEVAHLQGARHDLATDNSSAPFQYGHGYVDFGYHFRTIMAYPSLSCPPATCPRIDSFSTDDVVIPSPSLGSSGYEDNSRVLGETMYTISGMRQPITVSIAGPETVTGSQWCSWTTAVYGGVPVASYSWWGVASGSGPSLVANVNQSGYLSVTVYDSYGRSAEAFLYVAVDELGPSC